MKFLIYLLFILSFSACNSLSVSDTTTEGSEESEAISCPIGFVAVPKNPLLLTYKDFCVMQVEARDNGGVVGHDPLSSPWANIDQDDARDACSALGADYGLISNPEWMTIARNIEIQSSNWDTGIVGTGCLYMGNSGLDGPCSYSIGLSADSGDLSTRNPLAKHTLSNGSVIWDLSANLIEWVDWNVTDKAFSSLDGAPFPLDREHSTIDQMISSSDEMSPITWQASGHPAYSTANGIGDYTAGWQGSGGAAQRGGHFQHYQRAGIYQLDINNPPSNSNSYIGFRCVYRP